MVQLLRTSDGQIYVHVSEPTMNSARSEPEHAKTKVKGEYEVVATGEDKKFGNLTEDGKRILKR